MASCYCSPATVFAWIATILILSAFISLISWGAATNWPLGFSLSAIFSIFLFGMATFLQRRAAKQEAGDGDEDDDEEGSDGNTKSGVAGLGILTSLLFLLGCFSVGVTGFFLPVNLIKCDAGETYYGGGTSPSGQWLTDTTDFPQEVQAWESGSKMAPYNNFAYIPSTSVTLFSAQEMVSAGGNDRDDTNTYTWKIATDGSTSGGPEKLADTLACTDSYVVLPTDDMACFIAASGMFGGSYCDRQGNGVVACTDGTNIDTTDAASPRDLIVDTTGTVWYKANPPSNNDYSDVIYSIADPRESMEPTLRSSYTTDSSTFPNASATSPEAANGCGRKIAATCLFVSVLPVLVISIVLWLRRNVRSMPVSTYGGLTGIVVTLYYIFVDPLDLVQGGDESILDVLRWWFFVSSALWLVGLTLLFFTRRIHKHTMSWSFNFASLTYFVGSIILFKIFTENDDAWRWIGITLITFIPLILGGLATDHFCGLLLGAIGLLLDVWRITAFAAASAPDGTRVPIWFVMMGGAGVMLGVLGFFLNKQQKRIQGAVSGLAGKFLGRFVRRENDGDDGDDEEGGRGPVVVPVTRKEDGDEGVQGTAEMAVATVA